LVERQNARGDETQNQAHVAARFHDGHAEASFLRVAVGEVAAAHFLKLLLIARRRDFLHQPLGGVGRQHVGVHDVERAVQAHHGRLAHLAVQVGAVAVHDDLQHLVHVQGHDKIASFLAERLAASADQRAIGRECRAAGAARRDGGRAQRLGEPTSLRLAPPTRAGSGQEEEPGRRWRFARTGRGLLGFHQAAGRVPAPRKKRFSPRSAQNFPPCPYPLTPSGWRDRQGRQESMIFLRKNVVFKTGKAVKPISSLLRKIYSL
jgi:hypothetical protein